MLGQHKFYVSIERLVNDVEETIGQYIPLPQLGELASLSSFRRWSERYNPRHSDHSRIVIPPDPAGFLTFPTLRQELAITRSDDDPVHSGFSIEQIGKDFGFSESQLLQPIYSFSGGEKVRAALAKASLLLYRAKSLSLCMPTHWLHIDSYIYVNRLLTQAANLKINTTLFLLEGDISAVEKMPEKYTSKLNKNQVSWFIETRDFTLALESGDINNDGDRYMNMKTSSLNNLKLASPTIVVGANGSGKSLFAKCLAGAMGRKIPVLTKSKSGSGFGRLIVQDSLNHLFRSKINHHSSRVFEFDQEGKKKTDELFLLFCSQCKNELWQGLPDDSYLVGSDSEPATLMQAKIMLAAERLAYPPNVLIIDEPSWGLSLKQAKIYCKIIIAYCHSKDIPVLIITHNAKALEITEGSSIYVERYTNDIKFELTNGYT